MKPSYLVKTYFSLYPATAEFEFDSGGVLYLEGDMSTTLFCKYGATHECTFYHLYDDVYTFSEDVYTFCEYIK